jgi:uncharacterized damage-inducible protein DinB
LTVERLFIEFSINKLEQLHSRIKDCLNKLGEDEIWARGAENENAIGNLVLHLTGNVRQWIVAGVGGETDTRLRDQEFNARGDTHKQELIDRLEATLAQAKAVLENLAPPRLTSRVTIQKYEVTVLEAIYHVVEHFSQHTGQIIFATKMLTGDDLGFYKHLKAAAHAETTP